MFIQLDRCVQACYINLRLSTHPKNMDSLFCCEKRRFSQQKSKTLSARGLRVKLITLLTDFGLQDGYPGIMKGVIWGIAPDVQIADLTHSIHPQDILEGALTLGRAAPYFPPGTIHLGVVDPGVGTQRRAMAARIGECFFVGPDNGLCTALLDQAAGMPQVAVQLDRPRFWLPEVSHSFHGRDIFAPAAAHLANGLALDELGSPLAEIVRLVIPRPMPLTALGRRGWRGQVIHVDAFGNLATNFTREHLSTAGDPRVRIAGQEIRGLVHTFGEGLPGDLLAMLDSAGQVSVCEVNGSAARRLNVAAGEPVELYWQD
jgi:S-adenosyl-L-methionine hydrolase (adenosine-forming)